MLFGMWLGLGVSVSYFYIESEIQCMLGDDVYVVNLLGFFENVVMLIVFWEYEGFEICLFS